MITEKYEIDFGKENDVENQTIIQKYLFENGHFWSGRINEKEVTNTHGRYLYTNLNRKLLLGFNRSLRDESYYTQCIKISAEDFIKKYVNKRNLNLGEVWLSKSGASQRRITNLSEGKVYFDSETPTGVRINSSCLTTGEFIEVSQDKPKDNESDVVEFSVGQIWLTNCDDRRRIITKIKDDNIHYNYYETDGDYSHKSKCTIDAFREYTNFGLDKDTKTVKSFDNTIRYKISFPIEGRKDLHTIIQEFLFTQGINWELGAGTVKYTDTPFLSTNIHKQNILTFSNNKYTHENVTKTTAEDFIDQFISSGNEVKLEINQELKIKELKNQVDSLQQTIDEMTVEHNKDLKQLNNLNSQSSHANELLLMALQENYSQLEIEFIDSKDKYENELNHYRQAIDHMEYSPAKVGFFKKMMIALIG